MSQSVVYARWTVNAKLHGKLFVGTLPASSVLQWPCMHVMHRWAALDNKDELLTNYLCHEGSLQDSFCCVGGGGGGAEGWPEE